MAPVVWACIERGDFALVGFEQPYAYADDYRLQLLLRNARCELYRFAGVESRNTLTRTLSRARWRPGSLRRILRDERVDACFFEWGPGIPEAMDRSLVYRLRRRRAAVRYRSRLLTDIVDELLTPLRLSLLLACQAAGIPAIALPHGISTKMEVTYNPKLRLMAEQHGGVLPLGDRNAFTVWVHNTRRERELSVTVNGMRPEIAQVWGSLRFSPEWMQVMRRECPPARLPDLNRGQRRLVFFLPKWRNNVDRRATLELLGQLSKRRDLQLVLKEHPRTGTSELLDAELETLIRQPNVHRAASGDHSGALVTAADVIIDIGSGMALEAVLQKRHLIYPVYLHTNRLALDEWGGCLFARDLEEVHSHLDQIIDGGQPVLAGAAVAPLVRELVYGGRPPYLVADYYHACISAALEGRQPAEPVGCEPLAVSR